MKVLSIDPGYEKLGIAVIEKDKGKKEEVLFSECFKTNKKDSHEKRLLFIKKEVEKITKKYKPDFFTTETLFFNTNQKTAIKVAGALGVVLSIIGEMNIDVLELSPTQIKLATTGNGQASKKAMIKMVPLLCKMHHKPKEDDEFDAIAIGLAGLALYR